jgi:hypothetical protein
MPGCVFRASGKDFDVEAFVAQTTLKPYQVFHRGEVPHKSRGPREDSGLKVDVSQADGCIAEACPDVIDWLFSNMAELERLAVFPGVEILILNFGYYLQKEAAVQFDYLPPRLVKLAAEANIGIELSLYIWVADESEAAKGS